jgi:hypothetical protein
VRNVSISTSSRLSRVQGGKGVEHRLATPSPERPKDAQISACPMLPEPTERITGSRRHFRTRVTCAGTTKRGRTWEGEHARKTTPWGVRHCFVARAARR